MYMYMCYLLKKICVKPGDLMIFADLQYRLTCHLFLLNCLVILTQQQMIKKLR